mmetsp:Transcript_36809/g.110399  ORF Transcript_36809/g.110399 Transcript_36809/m.110399 type:complete len:321 (-) Transcript_36809:129-1091(-)|eukprot:CAMPEP_0113576538 /NCGR_PEP_ID=MMETSP0015_2-20120614/28352_1 /TAXON_ID=2838 /ORGANISM="Odontella" /LENGTH=320 /DNA_ID=CAMNT_0000479985 /DNA_START=21 /DNA_END=983 /DNA_ORIENTATION=+ /assembly_acc=CAM_ASM_000160
MGKDRRKKQKKQAGASRSSRGEIDGDQSSRSNLPDSKEVIIGNDTTDASPSAEAAPSLCVHDGTVASETDNTLAMNITAEEKDECPSEGGAHDTKSAKKEKRNNKKKVRRLSLTETENFNAKLRRRGVLYISRIPPRMGPAKVKSLMSDFGTVTRVYLVEEDKSVRKRRRRQTGSKSGGGKRYVEGWVEFEDKKVARRVGESLNGTPVTNNKRSPHYGDLWCVKYLRKFKWEHLTERVAFERRVREQKLRVEMMQARREGAAYASLVEAGKTMDRIEERRKKRRKVVDDDNRPKRKFRQTAPVEDKKDTAAKRAVLGSLV